MKSLLVVICFLLGTTMAFAEELPVPDDFRLSPLLRASHFVSDVDESLKLYRDILGLEVRIDIAMEGEAINRLLNTQDKKVRATVLKSGELYNGGVGLFQFLDEEPNFEPREEDYGKTGDAYLVFITSDIFGIYQKIKEAGYLVASEPMVLFPKEGDAQDYEMIFFDRDGIGVNLIERDVIK